MNDGGVVWLYAVMPSDSSRPPPATRGVSGESVRVLTQAALAAAVGTVDARQFGTEALARNLEDLDWLAATARLHDAVIAELAADGPVVPVRLATLFGSDDGVQELLASRRDDFQLALDTVTGRAEWGVKAYLDRAALVDQLVKQPAGRSSGSGAAAGAGARTRARARTERSSAAAGSGSEYLMRRRAQLAAKHSAESMADMWAREIHDRLRPLSAASRLHPAQDPRLSGRRDWMILNSSYLVDLDRTGQFRARVEQLADWQPSLQVELTGPWPPYSFAVSSGKRDGVRDDR
jgi:hypothetical protein